jgi:alpha-glucosidase (family GH31 glycosyl hydrolase)
MYKVYLKGGALVYPLFFDYPEDDKCFEDVEHTYMLGDAIKVSPVLEAGPIT